MTFKKENIASFEQIFDESKKKIRHFEGCLFLELYQDRNNPCIFFTYSYWQGEAFLDNYRKSELFKVVWGKTKKLFSTHPEAWSANKVRTLK